MIQLFKKNDIINVMALVPYVLLLRMYSFLYPKAYALEPRDGILNQWIFEVLIPNPLAQSIVAALLVLIQGLMLTFLINRHKLFNVPASLPGLLYVLFSSVFIEFQQLTPQLIGLTFLILSGFGVFGVYKKQNAVSLVFNAAIFVALASLFYQPFILAALGLFIEISILRDFKLRERLTFLIGLVVIFWILGSILFYFKNQGFTSSFEMSLGGSVMGFLELPYSDLSRIGGFTFFTIVTGVSYYTYMKKKSIEGRKKITMFYWILLMVFASAFIFIDLNIYHMLFGLISFSALYSMNFMSIRNSSMAEMLHILLLIGVFVLQYGHILVQTN